MTEELTLSEKVNKLFEVIEEGDKKAIKKLKLKGKAKVKKGKLKKGWIGILRVDRNGNISGEKAPIEGNAFTQKDQLTHATEGGEILWWEGKFPVIIQPTWKNNPVNIEEAYEDKKNETYGQLYIKAKMLKDVIKPKRQGSTIWWIIGLVIVVYFVYSKFLGGG